MNEGIDPYRAPESGVQDASELEVFELASRGRRFGTFIADYVCRLLIVFMIAIVVVIVKPELGEEIENMSGATDLLLGIISLLAYYLFFEGLFGRTPGKLLFGTRVIDERGLPPGLGQVAGRTLSRIVPFEPFSILFANDADVRGWHDRWSGTRVVRTR